MLRLSPSLVDLVVTMLLESPRSFALIAASCRQLRDVANECLAVLRRSVDGFEVSPTYHGPPVCANRTWDVAQVGTDGKLSSGGVTVCLLATDSKLSLCNDFRDQYNSTAYSKPSIALSTKGPLEVCLVCEVRIRVKSCSGVADTLALGTERRRV